MVVTWKATGGVLFRSSFLFHSTLPHNTLTQTLSSFSLRFRGRAKLTSSLTVSCVSAFIRFTQVSKNCSLYLSLTLIIAFRRSIIFSVSQNSFNRSITAFAVLSEKGYCNVRDLFSTPLSSACYITYMIVLFQGSGMVFLAMCLHLSLITDNFIWFCC